MQVKVWNDNIYEYKENFRDSLIVIPSKQFIMMDHDEAQTFRSTFNGFMKDVDGAPDPKGFKKIRIEVPNGGKFLSDKNKINELKCIVCGYLASSKEDLLEHINANHENERLKDEEAEKFVTEKKEAQKLKDENGQLKAEIEALKSNQTTSHSKKKTRKKHVKGANM